MLRSYLESNQNFIWRCLYLFDLWTLLLSILINFTTQKVGFEDQKINCRVFKSSFWVKTKKYFWQGVFLARVLSNMTFSGNITKHFFAYILKYWKLNRVKVNILFSGCLFFLIWKWWVSVRVSKRDESLK